MQVQYSRRLRSLFDNSPKTTLTMFKLGGVYLCKAIDVIFPMERLA